MLEAALSAGADVPALLATRSAARSLLQASAVEAFAFTAKGSVMDGGTSLAVADFFSRAFVLVGDVEVSTSQISCWRIRCADYYALLSLVRAHYLGFYSDFRPPRLSCFSSVYVPNCRLAAFYFRCLQHVSYTLASNTQIHQPTCVSHLFYSDLNVCRNPEHALRFSLLILLLLMYTDRAALP